MSLKKKLVKAGVKVTAQHDVDVTIEINTGNAAFEDNSGPELARILRKLADQFEESELSNSDGKLKDINGNTVGTWKMKGNY